MGRFFVRTIAFLFFLGGTFSLSIAQVVEETFEPLLVPTEGAIEGMRPVVVSAMNYERLDSVAKNAKLELGVLLPTTIRQRVASFVANGNSDNRINPFDPQELDIQAYFSCVTETGDTLEDRVFGFYYQDFQRNGNLKDWTRVNGATQPEFRIRYTPQHTGIWKCAVVVHLPQEAQTFEAEYFYFEVVDKGLPGFVRISDNKRALELDDALFLPLGMNLPTQGGTITGYRKSGANPAEYVAYYSNLKDLKESGGNYFRYLCTPWTTEVEFESLGNYSNRMPQAWEMDQLIAELERLDLRMHFNLSYTTPLTYTGVFSLFFWDWTNKDDTLLKCAALPNWIEDDPGYCYHTDPEFGVETIDEFLSNPTSIRYYQNRLRYIISRWGYSTYIVGLELMNEINFSGVQYALAADCGVDPATYENKPYYNDLSYVRKLSDWQIEMARYVKEELGHEEHPFVVNYGGTPNYVDSTAYHFDLEDGISLNGGDDTYFSEYVDLVSYNDYFRWFEKYEFQYKDYQKLKAFGKRRYAHPDSYKKPLIYSEIGMGKHGCDDQFTFKQLYLMSPFSGAVGAGMPWHYNNNMPEYDSTEQRLDAWSIMPVVDTFFNDVPLNKSAWTPGFDVRTDRKVEMLYLKETESSAARAVGVINNRTVNRYTMREDWCDENPTKCDCYLTEEELNRVPAVYKTPESIGWKDGKKMGGGALLKMSGMEYTSRYRIVFYDGLTGEQVAEDVKWSDAVGQLKIRYPKLAASPKRGIDETNGSMLLVKVYKYDRSSFGETGN